MIKRKLCKKGHELKPNNIIWFMGIHGKYLRKCKKCDNERRRSATRKQLEHRRYMRRSANKLKYLNVTAIIQGMMGYGS